MHEVNWWKAPRMWAGATVYVIGGGPSVAERAGLVPGARLSDKAVNAISESLVCIHNEPVIGVNAAYKLGLWVDVCFWGDEKFWRWYHHELENWPNLVVTNNVNLRKLPGNLPNVQRIKRLDRGFSDRPDRLGWNMNSGAAAVNLAVLFGAKKVVMIGFDMAPKTDGGEVIHQWHDFYEGKPREHPDEDDIHDKHLARFDVVIEECKKAGVELVSATPTRLKVPTMILDSAVPVSLLGMSLLQYL